MKLIVLRSNLLDALSYIEKGVGGDSSLPILKNVLLKTEGNKIIMVGTNLELAITSMFSGKIIENGETTIPFSVFFSIVKNLNAERISI
ncbi:MAG: polymerase III subunit beta protein, partial [Candidatus Jorgensenbacteria bacterium GW2011_GWA2_45_13]